MPDTPEPPPAPGALREPHASAKRLRNVPDLADAPPPPHAPPAPEPAPPDGGMARRVGRGVSWMLLSTGVGKAMTFVAQVALGWLLSQDDFGLWGITLAVTGFLAVFRDGGVRELLVQRPASEYERLSGPVFWMALAVNSATALAIVAASPLVALAYGRSALVPLLVITAISLPLGTPAAILRCRLLAQMRFGVLSRIAMASAVVRYGGTVLLAAMGFGPLSFVLPLVGVALYESVATYLATREQVWRRPPRIATWPGIFGQTKWLIFGSGANLMLDMGHFLVLGLVLDTAVFGVYVFAYNLVSQLGVLLSYNVQTVLMPALARLNEFPERQRDGVSRAMRLVMMTASPLCLALAVVAEPLEMILWGGRWAAAVGVIAVLAAFFPPRIAFGPTTAILLAQGRFKRWGVLTLAEGAAMTAAAAALGAATADLWWIALGVGASLAASRLAVTWHALGTVGIEPLRRARATVPAWALAVIAAALVVLADRAIGLSGVIAGWLAGPLQPLAAAAGTGQLVRLNALVRFVLLGGAFWALFLLMARAALASELAEAARTVPGPLSRAAHRILALPRA